jgi:hypothetical protein
VIARLAAETGRGARSRPAGGLIAALWSHWTELGAIVAPLLQLREFGRTPSLTVGVSVVDRSNRMGYTSGMKTAVSLPDKVFRQAETFARRSKKTRSRLYAEAIAEYLARHAPDDITESMNKVLDRVGLAMDAFSSEAARSLLAQEQW